jgi:hypothetical protein
MKEKNKIVGIIILIALICYILGMVSYKRMAKYSNERALVLDKILNLINSKTTSDLMIMGEVSKIEGNVLTVKTENGLIPISIKEDAKIIEIPYFLSDAVRGFVLKMDSPEINYFKSDKKLSELKEGEMVNVYLEIKENGDYQGKTILLLGAFPPYYLEMKSQEIPQPQTPQS